MELEYLAKKFDRFGWDRDRKNGMQDRLKLDWMDALQDYPLNEVQNACRLAVLENPNKMPNEGHIKAIVIRERGKLLAAAPKVEEFMPDRIEPSDDAKARANDLVASLVSLARFPSNAKP